MNTITNIVVGDVLTRPKALGIATHFGVVIAPNAVLQNTPERGEHLTTVQDFSAGKPITVHRTGVHPSIVVARAHNALANPQKYDLIQNNCEHTTTKIVQGIAKSSQIAFFLTLAVLGGAVFLASKKS